MAVAQMLRPIFRAEAAEGALMSSTNAPPSPLRTTTSSKAVALVVDWRATAPAAAACAGKYASCGIAGSPPVRSGEQGAIRPSSLASGRKGACRRGLVLSAKRSNRDGPSRYDNGSQDRPGHIPDLERLNCSISTASPRSALYAGTARLASEGELAAARAMRALKYHPTYCLGESGVTHAVEYHLNDRALPGVATSGLSHGGDS